MTIAYQIGNKLYLNVTNRCTNDCDFCIRRGKTGIEGHNLWLEKEPQYEEVIKAIGDPTPYEEIVFVGFGEPLYRIDLVKEVARWIKAHGVPVRVDTNGQANLIHGRNVVPELKGLLDTISISLNATSAKEYDRLCHSVYGEDAYDAMLNFAKEAKKYIPRVILSVVDYGGVDLEKARKIAEEMGVEFRVREYIE
ncbi:radical SAM protein [Anoxybacter fermentans]|uniref:Radical SAM protein n=1 Tax=Anoxybacter fermentans TaxID=1323375 RepID=A0A3S9T1Y3_9FIRM|nr:TatD family nuclease-associated radical SAM protein [Anoxybacter fermentans]AZR74432.1 radical SAM protein [Anoxybacter fermentans]